MSPSGGARSDGTAKASTPHDEVTKSRGVDELPLGEQDEGEVTQQQARDPDPLDLVGDVLDGQFRVVEYAGEGDFSLVYKGHHLGVDAPVAIKCLNLPSTLEQALVDPFIETFREGAKLHYRLAQGNLHIAQAISFGTTLAPRTGKIVPYIVREWLEGRSLAAELAVRRGEGLGPRSLADALRLMASAADGIAFAHLQGLVHHSINPRNLFVVPTMRGKMIKVLDFGVAKALNESVGEAGTPGHGLRVLFPAYAAPEQLDRKYGLPCAATDVYALALVIYEVLRGEPVYPPTAVTSEILDSLEPGKRPCAASLGIEIPAEVEDVLQRALTIEPAARQGNAGAFWRELAQAAKRAGTPASDRSLFVKGPAAAEKPSGPHIVSTSTAVPFTPAQMATIPPAASLDPVVATHDEAPPSLTPIIVPATIAVVGLIIGVTTTAIRLVGPKTPTPSPTVEAIAPAPPPSASSLASAQAAPSASASAAPLGHKSKFDKKEAAQALAAASQGLDQACATTARPRGPGSARVRFNNDGTVTRITLGPPYAQTTTGACVAEHLKTVRISSFDGAPVAFNYTFTTIPWK